MKSAIISQLSSTTLQIPALSSVNWTAGGFIITALLISVLAVMLSCVQQQALGTLNEAGGVRMWLSNGSASRVGSKDGNDAFFRGQHRDGLETSVASLLLLKLPNTLLLYGVTCFLVGFGLYLGFAWRQGLENTPSRDSNFSVMILYIVVGCVTFFGSGAVVKWKMSEVIRAEKVIGKDIEEGDDGEERSGDRSEDESSGTEGEVDNLLLLKKKKNGKKKKKGMNLSRKEVTHHERVANALENAARAHREIAKLMNNADQGNEDGRDQS